MAAAGSRGRRGSGDCGADARHGRVGGANVRLLKHRGSEVSEAQRSEAQRQSKRSRYNRHMRWSELRSNVRDALHGLFYFRYEQDLRAEAIELNDLFLLMC